MPEFLEARRREDGDWFYCPNGHPQHYSESTVQKLRRELGEKAVLLTATKCSLAAEMRAREAAEQDLQRHKSRVKNGVCPCCNRSFANLRRHMASKHPNHSASK